LFIAATIAIVSGEMRLGLGLRAIVGLCLTMCLIGFSQATTARPMMDVATFLATHARLSHSKSEMNVGGADFYAGALLRSIGEGGSKAVRANDLARRQGHPLFCPPAGSKGFGLNIEELHAFFDTIPVEQRGMTMDDAMLRFAEHKFPCVITP
jgi:hypothetical protein